MDIRFEMRSDDPRSQWERMIAGEWYRTDAEILSIQQQRARIMEAFNACPMTDVERRRELLGELVGSAGPDAEVRPPVYVDYGSNVRIGSGVFLNNGCVLADVASITIGDDVQVGPYVQFLTPVHPVEAGPRRDKWETARPITIGDNVWIGGGAIICPGVTVGSDTVIGAGAVVTKDLPAGVVAVGNPARVVRDTG